MIRVEVHEHVATRDADSDNPSFDTSFTLRVRDGYNRSILLSSTSQQYQNRLFVEQLATRLFAIPAGAPAGTESVELWFISHDGVESKIADLR